MAITYPYPLAFLADTLPIAEVTFDVQRNDEMSGTGDGRLWSAELAPPLWTADVTLGMPTNDEAIEIAAKIRRLHGAREAFFLYDPLRRFPKNDPGGTLLSGRTMRIVSIASGRDAIAVGGFPANFRLAPGDKFSIEYFLPGSPLRFAFLEVGEPVQASGGGTTPQFSIFPRLPAGIAINAETWFVRPFMKAVMVPGSFNAGVGGAVHTRGMRFTAIQKK